MKYIVIDNHDKDNKLNFENFTKMVDYFEPNEEDFPEFHDKMDIIRIRVSKGKKEEYKAIADAEGKSLNQYIVDRIEGVK